MYARAREARAAAERELVWRPGGLFRDDEVMAKGIYVALGDSISIDDYTGVRGGGAASHLARKLGLDLVDLTRDGNTAHGVLADLAGAPASAAVVTLTAGGNDLLAATHRARSCAGLTRSPSGCSGSAAVSSSTPSTTRATATTAWDDASSVCRGWRRSSYDGA